MSQFFNPFFIFEKVLTPNFSILLGIKLVGAGHVALGSDFDGTINPGFDTAELVAITHELLELGIDDNSIRLVMGENMLNFLQENLPKI